MLFTSSDSDGLDTDTVQDRYLCPCALLSEKVLTLWNLHRRRNESWFYIFANPELNLSLSIKCCTSYDSGEPTLSCQGSVKSHSCITFMWAYYICFKKENAQWKKMCCVNFIPISVRLLEAYRYGRNVPTSNCGGSVGWYHLQFKQDQHNTVKKNTLEKWRTFWAKTVHVSMKLQTYLRCYLPWQRDRLNSWEGSDRMGNECQLDGNEGEVDVHAKSVCLLRRPLLDVLCNIHPNVRYAWKYKGSDGYIV